MKVFLALCVTFIVVGKSKLEEEVLRGVKQNADGTGTIKFTPPTLDDEENFSMHMPTNLKCDGCRILAHKIKVRFDVYLEQHKSISRIPELDVMDILDSVCKESYGDVGLKEVDGVKRLSGPGLDTANVAGVIQGGGRWPNRLQSLCSSIVGEIGEDEIYEDYRNHKDTFSDMLCKGDDARSSCNKKEKKKQAKKIKVEKNETMTMKEEL